MTQVFVRLLSDVVAYGREAIETVGDRSAEQIVAERLREHSVLRTVQIVGEAAAQAVKIRPVLLSQVPDLRRAIGLRNVLVHGYTGIRMDEIVRIVRNDMPILIDRVEQVLREAEA